MKKRRTADQIARMLKEADRELARGLTVPDVCRKNGIAQGTYYRWRQWHDPARVDDERRRRELELEVDRPAADYLAERYGASQRRACRVKGRARSNLRYRRVRRPD